MARNRNLKSEKPTGPRFVEYIRSNNEDDSSQDLALDRLRRERPGVLVMRVESASSGAELHADVAMLAEVFKCKHVDELRVARFDRLTRVEDPRELSFLYGVIEDAGAKIVDSTGRVIDLGDTSGMGHLDFYLATFFAAEERRRSSVLTRRGLEASKLRKQQEPQEQEQPDQDLE